MKLRVHRTNICSTLSSNSEENCKSVLTEQRNRHERSRSTSLWQWNSHECRSSILGAAGAALKRSLCSPPASANSSWQPGSSCSQLPFEYMAGLKVVQVKVLSMDSDPLAFQLMDLKSDGS